MLHCQRSGRTLVGVPWALPTAACQQCHRAQRRKGAAGSGAVGAHAGMFFALSSHLQALESVQGGLEQAGNGNGSSSGGSEALQLAALMQAVPEAASEAAAAYCQVWAGGMLAWAPCPACLELVPEPLCSFLRARCMCLHTQLLTLAAHLPCCCQSLFYNPLKHGF